MRPIYLKKKRDSQHCPQTHYQYWGQGQESLFLPRRAPCALPAPWLSTLPADTSRAPNRIKRGRLSGTVDYRLGLGRVILSSLPFPAATSAPGSTSQPCQHGTASARPCRCCWQPVPFQPPSLSPPPPSPRHTRNLHVLAVLGMVEQLGLLICNLSLCTWMISRHDQKRCTFSP